MYIINQIGETSVRAMSPTGMVFILKEYIRDGYMTVYGYDVNTDTKADSFLIKDEELNTRIQAGDFGFINLLNTCGVGSKLSICNQGKEVCSFTLNSDFYWVSDANIHYTIYEMFSEVQTLQRDEVSLEYKL